MTTYSNNSLDVTRFTPAQHATYVGVAFAIWVSGVLLVRILGSDAFDTGTPWPYLLFASSLVLGVAIQVLAPVMFRIPAEQTLVPVAVMAGAALMMDGLAVGFTDIYTSDNDVKVVVAGWLLWTFGTQLIISIFMIGRLHR